MSNKKSEQIHIRATREEWERWHAAAAFAGVSLSTWGRRLMDQAARACERAKERGRNDDGE